MPDSDDTLSTEALRAEDDPIWRMPEELRGPIRHRQSFDAMKKKPLKFCLNLSITVSRDFFSISGSSPGCHGNVTSFPPSLDPMLGRTLGPSHQKSTRAAKRVTWAKYGALIG